jgi:hypothetical protein
MASAGRLSYWKDASEYPQDNLGVTELVSANKVDINYSGIPANLPPSKCAKPPILNNPKVVTVSPNGGTYKFDENQDVLMKFPKQVVTRPVNIFRARNVHVVGGEMDINTGHYGMAFNFTNDVFVEGMRVNVNNRCDVFALRADGGDRIFTFQNIFATGPGYNTISLKPGAPPNCHGDLIQFQGQGAGTGSFTLRVENFTGVTGGQGFFLPKRTNGNTSVFLKNVNLRIGSNSKKKERGYPMLWFSNSKVDPVKYPVQLDEVYVDWIGPNQIFPQPRDGADHSNPRQVSFSSETLINGVVKQGGPNGGKDFVVPSQVGWNYNRGAFCTN